MKTTKIDLCKNWRLATLTHGEHKDYTSYRELQEDGVEIIPASVPSTVELDLKAAGKITKDLFFGTNSWEINAYTQMLHCYYFTTFNTDRVSGSPRLVFEGIDCYADIYVNGKLAASVDNMFMIHTVDISRLIAMGENEIFIHIKPVVVEAMKYEYPFMVSAGINAYEQLYVRKPAHMFGWDITPRYVSAGLYRPVSLVYTDGAEGIEEYYLCTASATREKAVFEFYYKTNCLPADNMTLKLEGDCGDSHFEEDILFNYPIGRRKIVFENPKLWWPRNFGEQNRYDFKITLSRDGEVIEEKRFKQGIASIKLDYEPTMDKDGNGKFCFIVNGEPIFVKGANWVPASPFHSEDKARIPRMLDLACELECNMLRLWGGNVYEDDLFYEICEEKGIMIWQDFGMACGKHPVDSEFCERMREEATQQVKRLRHYACIALWSGDNEGDLRWNRWEGIRMNPNDNIITRKLLPEVVMLHDTARTYLPSSPYISRELLTQKAGEGKAMPEVHFYIWGEFYKDGAMGERKAKFASEFGSICMPSPESAKKYISPENLFTGRDGNDEWVVHSSAGVFRKGMKSFRTRVPFLYAENLFEGEINDYTDLAMKSQIAACESDKFFFEYFRSQKWDKTGMLWWNLMDAWPQLSDAAVDYYFDKKLHYYGLKASMQNVCLMMRDHFGGEGHPLVAVNDTLKDVTITYKATDVRSGETLRAGNITIPANSNIDLAIIPTSEDTRFILLEWSGDSEGKNHYLDYNKGKRKLELCEYMEYLEKTALYTEWVEKTKKW